MVQRIELNDGMLGEVVRVLIAMQRLKHRLTAASAHVMSVNGDVPSRQSVVALAQRKQAA